MKERALDAVAKPTGEREANMSRGWTLVPILEAGAEHNVGGVGVLVLF